MRDTIDYGIHLGMTGAQIARCDGTDVTLIQNSDGQELTPVAVWLHPHGFPIAGRSAHDDCASDSENVLKGFIAALGLDTDYRFPRSEQRMTPEELSAVVLKSLRADAERDAGKPVTTCVLAVPIAATPVIRESYLRAARLAGFETVVHLPEPHAAALAHGFGKEPTQGLLLVYNLAATMFEATLLRLSGDSIVTIANAGDSELGWDRVIREVVETRLIPILIRQRLLELPIGVDDPLLCDVLHTSRFSTAKQIEVLATRYSEEQGRLVAAARVYGWDRQLLAERFHHKGEGQPLTEMARLFGFGWDCPWWTRAIALLQVAANRALDLAGSARTVRVPRFRLCLDDMGFPLDLQIEIERDELCTATAAVTLETAYVCRDIVKRLGYGLSEIRRVIPLSEKPFVWSTVEEQLGLPIDCTVGPTTAVVRGAAIYASTRRISDSV